jgi:hypothetical protein
MTRDQERTKTFDPYAQNYTLYHHDRLLSWYHYA